MKILEDPDKSLSIEDILWTDIRNYFEKSTGGIPNHGYTSSVYWVEVTVYNDSSKRNWLLEIDNPAMDYISLFFPNNGGFDERLTGDLHPFNHRDVEHRSFIYHMQFPPGEATVFYLRFETEGAMQLPLSLWDPHAFIKKVQVEYSLLGIFYGIAFVMALYNLFLYFSLRYNSYLFYVIFIVSNFFIHVSFTGSAYQYLWPDTPWWNNRSIVFFMSISNITAFLFAKSFLSLNKYTPRFNLAFNYLIVFSLCITILLFFSYSMALNLIVVSSFINVIVIFVAAFICYQRGYHPARYFLLAWTISIVGTAISLGADAGVIPVTFFTKYAWQMTSAVEFVLFSFALADKINVMRKEKEQAEAQKDKINQRLQEMNDKLEEKVKERTGKLEKANIELEKANEQLRKWEKSRKQLLSNISHELGTPITFLQGYVQSVRTGIIEGNDPKYLQSVENKIQLLDRLIQDLFDLSKFQTGTMRLNITMVDLRKWMNEIYTRFEMDVPKKNITFHAPVMDLPKESQRGFIYIDQERMDQVFTNLIYNAMKFTDSGGEISIYVKAVKKDTKDSNVDFDGEVMIEVKDTGRGIKQVDLPYVFDRFYKGINTRDNSGSGLGLAITQEIIHYHKGEIWVDSKEGEGTSFYFSLPISFE